MNPTTNHIPILPIFGHLWIEKTTTYMLNQSQYLKLLAYHVLEHESFEKKIYAFKKKTGKK